MILVALLVAAFAINLDIPIVNVALPSLVRELHASNSQLQWIVGRPYRPGRPHHEGAGGEAERAG